MKPFFLLFLAFSFSAYANEDKKEVFKGIATHTYRPGVFDSCWGDPCLSKAFYNAKKKCKEAGYDICNQVSSKEYYIFPIPKIKRCVVKVEGAKN